MEVACLRSELRPVVIGCYETLLRRLMSNAAETLMNTGFGERGGNRTFSLLIKSQ